MTTGAIYQHCPSAVDAAEVARLAYEMKKKGLIADGGKVLHALGMMVNSYILSTPDDPRIEAAKPIVVERKIPRTIKPTKPAQDHPFKARIVAKEAHDGAPRVTRPLPIHLTTTAPHDVAIDEEKMSEEPIPYITDVDTFSQGPMEPEADLDIDDELTSLLSEVAALKPDDDAMMQAGEYVGDQWTGPTIQFLKTWLRKNTVSATPFRSCQRAINTPASASRSCQTTAKS